MPGHGPGPRSELAQFGAESGERREERGARSEERDPGAGPGQQLGPGQVERRAAAAAPTPPSL